MSGIPFMLSETPPLMGAARARDLARIYKGFADHVRGLGDVSGANHAERQSQWFLAYSVALSQTPPGAIDER